MKNNFWMQAFSGNACPLCQTQCSAALFPLFWRPDGRESLFAQSTGSRNREMETRENTGKPKEVGCKAVLYCARLNFLNIDLVYSTTAFWFGQKRTYRVCKVCEIQQHTQYKMEDWEIFHRIRSLKAISLDNWAHLSIKCHDLIFKLPETTPSNL